MKNLSKSLLLFVVFVLMLVIASCSKDDGPETKQEAVVEQPEPEPEEEPEEVEEPVEEVTAEESNLFLDNVTIKGGTKVEGALPVSTAAISFDIETYGGSAFVDEGFNAELTSSEDFIGAYIQFKVNDALVSDNYYDVDLASNSPFAKTDKLKSFGYSRNFGAKSRIGSVKYSYYNLNVVFTPDIVAGGEFCYLIAVYDANGNISEPQEVCLEVKGWGGYDDLIGEWHYSKNEVYFPNGDITTQLVGEEGCFMYSFVCENGNSFDYETCTTKEEEIFDFKADGTYTHTYKSVRTRFDFEASEASCEAVIIDDFLNYTITGNWSFNETDRDIILVEYNQLFEDQEGTYEYINPVGEGDIFPFGPATIHSDNFTVGFGTENLGEDLNADGQVDNNDTGYLSFYVKQ
ncbi:hypothetical protein [Pseudozobellia sp. WGM2]|uniref:hypothetical protein n=1 Tax=Pseudozobellia sp. WGM2 TaxID=2787625 RepID=UPI001AE06404|nr:hypothetical protein [Pseudozobellia sp. WGM2]